MRISVLIPAYHAGERLLRGLRHLAAQTRLPEEVVIILSDPADTETPALLLAAQAEAGAGRWPWSMTLLRPPRRVHYGAAVNLGFAAATGEELVVLNDDTEAEPGFLSALAEARQRHGLALLQPRILLLDAPGHLDNAGHGLFFDGFNWARGREAPDAGTGRFAQPGTVGAVSGAAFWLPRAVLDAVGGFDESLEAFGEDVDLSLRAVRRGIPLRYVPEARIRHALGASYGRYGARKVFLVERNRVRVAARSLPLSALASQPLWTVARWGGLAVGAAVGRGWGVRLGTRARLAAVVGTAAGLRHLPDAWQKRRMDAEYWQVGEGGMWRHLLRERVRLSDLLRPPPTRAGEAP